ncbi:hypothetical protein CKO28_20360 [Rhodovibrio sodomensis]|uniref:DUF6916 domain-containing protein n=1 Tax=Rhodovibrio sodomensis TaxID=1088 RepID=A0ABS1DIS3_9PROT|nr:hypothetical protein [Rhodovibrio sodomensis]MBK1670381.1 hypothetical protein [Rhodovibrio sodomensis]
MLESLGGRDFERYVNQTFTLSTAEESFEAELIEVDESPRPRGGREGEGVPWAFSLTFAAPPATEAGQQTFAVSHPEIGTLELFVVPHGPQDDGRRVYIAVLN